MSEQYLGKIVEMSRHRIHRTTDKPGKPTGPLTYNVRVASNLGIQDLVVSEELYEQIFYADRNKKSLYIRLGDNE